MPRLGRREGFPSEIPGELYSAEELEIIFVRAGSGAPPLDSEFVGFDVADSQPPFYSFVGDPPSGPDLEAHLERLNETGLFSNVQDADSTSSY